LYKFDFVAPRSPEDAVAQMRERGPGGKFIAGGTDLLLQTKARLAKPSYVLDLSRLSELERLDCRPGEGLWIGATVRMRTIQLSPLFHGPFGVVADGAKLVGSIQIRNLATIGGNVCNAAPSADVAPALLAAGARAEVLGPNGTRSVPLEQFFLGPRRTVLEPGELLLGVWVPEPAPGSGGQYLRHTPRKEMDIAVVGVGSFVTLDGGICADARIALGAVAATPLRATRAEAALRGQPLSTELIAHAARLAAEDARPITDVRGTVEFRRHLVNVLTQRTLSVAWNNAMQGGSGR
jgi:carbon-monoxide dehydrogenase medium subunit